MSSADGRECPESGSSPGRIQLKSRLIVFIDCMPPLNTAGIRSYIRIADFVAFPSERIAEAWGPLAPARVIMPKVLAFTADQALWEASRGLVSAIFSPLARTADPINTEQDYEITDVAAKLSTDWLIQFFYRVLAIKDLVAHAETSVILFGNSFSRMTLLNHLLSSNGVRASLARYPAWSPDQTKITEDSLNSLRPPPTMPDGKTRIELASHLNNMPRLQKYVLFTNPRDPMYRRVAEHLGERSQGSFTRVYNGRLPLEWILYKNTVRLPSSTSVWSFDQRTVFQQSLAQGLKKIAIPSNLSCSNLSLQLPRVLAPLILEQFGNRFEQVTFFYELARRWFLRDRPLGLMVSPGRLAASEGAVIAAKELQLPNAEVQAGTISPSMRYYGPRADEIYVADDESARIYRSFFKVSPERLVVTGSLPVARKIALFKKWARFLPSQHRNGTPRVLLALQTLPAETSVKQIEDLGKILSPEAQLRVVFHPSSKRTYNRKVAYMAKDAHPRLRFLQGNTLLHVQNSLVIVTFYSTLAFEAFALGKPVIAHKPFENHGWPFRLSEAGVAAESASIEELGELLKGYLDVHYRTKNSTVDSPALKTEDAGDQLLSNFAEVVDTSLSGIGRLR